LNAGSRPREGSRDFRITPVSQAAWWSIEPLPGRSIPESRQNVSFVPLILRTKAATAPGGFDSQTPDPTPTGWNNC